MIKLQIPFIVAKFLHTDLTLSHCFKIIQQTKDDLMQNLKPYLNHASFGGDKTLPENQNPKKNWHWLKTLQIEAFLQV